jgi:hypothetical protein
VFIGPAPSMWSKRVSEILLSIQTHFIAVTSVNYTEREVASILTYGALRLMKSKNINFVFHVIVQ